MPRCLAISALFAALLATEALAQNGAGAPCVAPGAYQSESMPLLKAMNVNLERACKISADFELQFTLCDNDAVFRDKKLPANGCKSDPNNLRTLLRLSPDMVYWDSKMAVDLDGTWASVENAKTGNSRWPKHTDDPNTSFRWPNTGQSVDGDVVPYIAIPAAVPYLDSTDNDREMLADEFRTKTNIAFGNFGVAIYGNKWIPFIVADAGRNYRIGEASARVHREIASDRCIGGRYNSSEHCVGDGIHYPYEDSSPVNGGAIYIVVTSEIPLNLSAANARAMMCQMVKARFGLSRTAYCP
jgi:hypothetical protein